jgi:hypothetical protein
MTLQNTPAFIDLPVFNVPGAKPATGQLRLFQTDGATLQVIDSDGNSALPSGGSPGGGDTAVQFNNAGAFDGDENSFAWDEATKSLTCENGGAETVIQFVAGAEQSMDITLDATQDPPVATFDNTETGGILDIHSDGDLTIISDSGVVHVQNNGSGELSFFGASGHAKPAITGSKGANAALTSLLSALAALGLVTDSTT